MAHSTNRFRALDAGKKNREMASVYKRGNTWWVRFQWRGQEIRRSARTASKGEAREYLADLQAQYRRLDVGGRPKVSFEQSAVAYIEEDVSKKKLSTIQFYQNCIKTLQKSFGGQAIDEITRAKIAAFEAKEGRRVSPSRLKHYRAALSGIFRVAIRHDWVTNNPCRDLDPIEINNARYRFLSPAEWGVLQSELSDPHLGISEMSILRGMRLGEILSMKWRDVNLAQDTITLPDTKGNRPRVIPLEGARAVISRQPRVSDFVFTNTVGNRHAVSDVSKVVKRTAIKAGLDDFTFHDLRHTYASWYVQRGGDLYRLQQILGHKGPAMTQRYAHLRVDDLREVAQMSAHGTRDFLN